MTESRLSAISQQRYTDFTPEVFASQQVLEPIFLYQEFSSRRCVHVRKSGSLIRLSDLHLEPFGSRPGWQRHFSGAFFIFPSPHLIPHRLVRCANLRCEFESPL